MNLVYQNPCVPLRVLLVNPTQDAFVMSALKICQGVIFGLPQTIDLILLVYVNDVAKAEELRWHLEGSALPCNNNITITTTIPSITDADVFVFISTFPNPNNFEIDKVDGGDYFDSLYLFLKIANNFEMPATPEVQEEEMIDIKKIKPSMNKPRRPIIITDGIVTLDIIKNFSRNLPNDIFFCSTSISSMTKTILRDSLKTEIHDLNEVYVWAANDNAFYVDVKAPPGELPKVISEKGPCEADDVLDDERMQQLNIDHTHLNAAWLKKDFQNHIKEKSLNNPHGSIYKATNINQALRHIWQTRSVTPLSEYKCNIGVISDGDLGTIKGLPYVLPVVFHGETYTINKHLKEDGFLKQEIKRINKEAVKQHQILNSYCKQFMVKYIIRKDASSDVDLSDPEYRTGTTYTVSSDRSVRRFPR